MFVLDTYLASVCFAILNAILAFTAVIAPADPIEPNTECGTSAGMFPATAVSATGNSNTSQERANDEAVEKLDLLLGQLSGVICEICPTGVQCERKIRGKEMDDVDVVPGDMVDGQFTATATYTGSYEVKCKKCIEVQVGGGP